MVLEQTEYVFQEGCSPTPETEGRYPSRVAGVETTRVIYQRPDGRLVVCWTHREV